MGEGAEHGVAAAAGEKATGARGMDLLGAAVCFVLVAALGGRAPHPHPARDVPLPSMSGVPDSTPPRVSAPELSRLVDYPWGPADGDDRLDVRVAAPPGFTRIDVEPHSFAAFLRSLPLLPAGTPVRDFRGGVQRGPDSPFIAAVVDIDVGHADLQQCADFVIRLNAEWRYGRGDRSMAVGVLSGPPLSLHGYLGGERARVEDGHLVLRREVAPEVDDHRAFRAYLDEVFAWANTASLTRQSAAVGWDEVRGGDFFVASGNPFGHAVLVLDVAKDPSGRLALLLGEGYMPAQSFHVLRPGRSTAWFVLDASASEVATPFWAPFSVRALRRLL